MMPPITTAAMSTRSRNVTAPTINSRNASMLSVPETEPRVLVNGRGRLLEETVPLRPLRIPYTPLLFIWNFRIDYTTGGKRDYRTQRRASAPRTSVTRKSIVSESVDSDRDSFLKCLHGKPLFPTQCPGGRHDRKPPPSDIPPAQEEFRNCTTDADPCGCDDLPSGSTNLRTDRTNGDTPCRQATVGAVRTRPMVPSSVSVRDFIYSASFSGSSDIARSEYASARA